MSNADETTTAPQTILLVDDSPANLELVAESLETDGYEVLVAIDGDEALQRAEWVLPDLILLDVMMPGIDGFEVCNRLKANPTTANIPVIIMTALSAMQHKVEGFTAGAVDYLTKPLHIDEVRARVNAHLKLHTLHRQLEEKNTMLEREIAERKRYEAELHDSRELLRQLSTHREVEHEAERKRVAWQMHEELGQQLMALRINMMVFGNTLDKDDDRHEQFNALLTMLDDGSRQVREVTNELRPRVLDLGLVAALEWLAEDFGRRTGLACDWHDACGDLPLDEAHTLALFRAAEEALDNVACHAGAKSAQMMLERHDGGCRLTVRDDGRGFEPASTDHNPLGLMSIQERLADLGGVLEVNSRPDHGTTVTAWLPMKG